MPFYINVGRFALSSFGLMMTISLFISYVLALQISKHIGILKSQTENIFLAGTLSGIVLGRFFYIVKNHDQIPNLLGIFQIWNGGVDYYGTLVGAILGVVLVAWFYNIPILKALDITSVVGSLTLGLGYISAGFVGFGFGRPVSSEVDVTPGFHMLKKFPFFYIVYKFGEIAPPSIPFYPVQFMYGTLFIIYSILLIYYIIKKQERFPGELFSIFLIFYGFTSVVVGYYSTSHVIFKNITVEQFFGAFVLLSGLVILWLLKYEKINA
ncbi:prolipoprotein diacylglyceryl transferase [Hydrogenobaculum acidophilum]